MVVATMMFVVILIELVLIVFTLILSTWLYYYIPAHTQLKCFLAPTTWSILGHLWELQNAKELLTYIPNLMQTLNSKTIRLHLGLHTHLFTCDAKLYKKILNSPEYIHKEYKSVSLWLQNSLFTSTGENWKTLQNAYMPIFQYKMLHEFVNVFNSNGHILINNLRKQVKHACVDVTSFISLCSLDIISGVPVNVQLNQSCDYVKSIHAMTNIVHDRVVTPLYEYEFIFKWSQLYREHQKHSSILNPYADRLINVRRQQLQEKALQAKPNNMETNDLKRKKTICILDVLLKSLINERSFTDKELRDKRMAFMFAGHDTAASAISYTLYLLANHPDIQKKFVQEVIDVFGKNKRGLYSLDDIAQLRYIDIVIKESLRMYPTAPLFSRTLLKDCMHDGVVIPKGTNIAFFVYGLHRNPEYFPNPEMFDPERLFSDTYDCSRKFAFSAFSAGPRNCIGQKFALIGMKLLISLILRHFKLIPAVPKHALVLRSSLTLKAENGVKLGLVERK